jgi:hypothetical protein
MRLVKKRRWILQLANWVGCGRAGSCVVAKVSVPPPLETTMLLCGVGNAVECRRKYLIALLSVELMSAKSICTSPMT